MRITGGIPVGGNLGYSDLVYRGEPVTFENLPYYGNNFNIQPLRTDMQFDMFQQPGNMAVGNVGGLIAQTPKSAEQQTLQDYFGALLNPVGFINKTKSLVDKINKRNKATEDAIMQMRGY